MVLGGGAKGRWTLSSSPKPPPPIPRRWGAQARCLCSRANNVGSMGWKPIFL